MTGEQAADEANPVTDEESENQAEQTRSSHKAPMEPCESAAGEGKRQGEGRSYQCHSRDGADAENQQVENGPLRFANGAQDQQRDRSGACQAVNYADKQRAQGVKEPQSLEGSAQPTGSGEGISMMVAGRDVGMPVKVQVGAVSV